MQYYICIYNICICYIYRKVNVISDWFLIHCRSNKPVVDTDVIKYINKYGFWLVKNVHKLK